MPYRLQSTTSPRMGAVEGPLTMLLRPSISNRANLGHPRLEAKRRHDPGASSGKIDPDI